MDIAIRDGRFNVEAEWIDSFEVDICRTELGLMNEPVCWTVLGWALGVNSITSSRKMVPPLARSKRPARALTAPV
ncbi:MAG: hypothetical protein V7751_20280 [Pseudoalteromonas distincta]